MIAPFAWMAAILALILVAVAMYTVAPGAGVLVAIVGLVLMVVVNDRAEDRRWSQRERAERLRRSARRLP